MMTKTAAALAAALREAWKANGASSALAAAITQRKAVTANNAARPLSPMVIDLEMEGWLMRILSERTRGQKPHPRSRGIDRNQVIRISEKNPRRAAFDHEYQRLARRP